MLGLDSYYLDHSHLPMEDRAKVNYDHPDAFDWELLLQHVRELKSGKSVETPIYNYAVHGRMKETIPVNPGKVIVVEGNPCPVRQAAPRADGYQDIRRRGAGRPLHPSPPARHRGARDDRSTPSSTSTSNVVRKMHLGFVEPSKRHADVIIPKGGHNEIAIDMMQTKIQAILAQALGK
jgi:uridine kinase